MAWEEGKLYADVVSRGLQKLGPSPVTAQMAFLSLTVENEGVRDISLLKEYTHLQHVNLAGNAIEDITPLVALPKLKTLDLSHNQVRGRCAPPPPWPLMSRLRAARVPCPMSPRPTSVPAPPTDSPLVASLRCSRSESSRR